MLNQRESFSNLFRRTINNQGNTKVKWTVAKRDVINADGRFVNSAFFFKIDYNVLEEFVNG